jgi:uncharacterized membrane protein
MRAVRYRRSVEEEFAVVTFVLTLHVLSAVLILGPLATSPWHGLRAIRQHDARGTRDSGRSELLYTLLSLVVLGTGLLRVVVDDGEPNLGDVWVTISITLYVIVFVVGLAVVGPNLTRAATLLDGAESAPAQPLHSTPGGPTPGDPTLGGTEPEAPVTEPAGTDTATLDVDHRRKLDTATGRITAGGGLTSLLVIVLVILSVTQPF